MKILKESAFNEHKKEQALNILDDIEENLQSIINNLEQLENIFRDLGIHSADIDPYFIRYMQNFIDNGGYEISVSDLRNRLNKNN